MKCLCIKQPWAQLILLGYKTVENRSWQTSYRGELLIHASKTFDWEGFEWLRRTHLPLLKSQVVVEGLCNVPRGGIVGKVDLLGIDAPRTGHRHATVYRDINQFGWNLANPYPFKHIIECPGKLRLFEVSASMIPLDI